MASPAVTDFDDADANALTAASPYKDVPSRPMKAKILYSFDDDNKTNCLARIPDILHIPTVPIDDVQRIGLIELRQCIRAIVAASPELVARLSQGDFTIYAYDYSEYETPIVGQGMLSSILAATSPTPSAPAHQSRTMITGRVCTNLIPAFNNGVSETLEVKLRLVPVPRPMQHEYVKSMEMYRNLSPALSGGFDPNAWADFSSEGGVVANLERQTRAFDASASGRDSRASFRHDRRSSIASMNDNAFASRDQGSRPSSRSSIRAAPPQINRRDSLADFNSDGAFEDGSAPKRAKITQTAWKGKSAFGGVADSLRVTASSAASVRLHKPVATRPDLVTGNNLEPPPRVPTPTPLNDQAFHRARRLQASFIRRESSLMQAQLPESPYDALSETAMSSPEDMDALPTTEPSPIDLPSSPPCMPGVMRVSSPALPTVPRGADSGYMSGSVYDDILSEPNGSKQAGQKRSAPKKRDRPSLRTQGSDFSFVDETPGPPDLLPSTVSIRPDAQAKARSAVRAEAETPALPIINACQAGVHPLSQQNLHNLAGANHYAPIAPAQNIDITRDDCQPGSKPGRSRNREDAASPAPSDATGRPRSGGAAKRRKVIKDKLMLSLANGQMPQYCSNCGSIETPTWRTLHTRVVEGAPEDNEADQADVDSAGIEVLERDEKTEKVLKYRLIKSLQRGKDRPIPEQYVPITVCNPCGLWFNKFRYMRPSEKWNRERGTKKRSKGASGLGDGLQSDAVEPASDFPMSDFPMSDFPQSEAWQELPMPGETETPMPDGGADDSGSGKQQTQSEALPVEQQSSLPPFDPALTHMDHDTLMLPRQRAQSVDVSTNAQAGPDEWSQERLDAALKRAIQSSPGHGQGTQDGTQESPIDLEEDASPKPIRRLLFPSPRRPGEVKSLDDSCLPDADDSPSKKTQGKTTNIGKDGALTHPFIGAAMVAEKENQPPLGVTDDEFARLFSPSMFKTPLKTISGNAMRTPPTKSTPNFDAFLTTPTPSRRIPSGGLHITRTPGRTMDEFLPSFSSAERRELLGTPSKYINFSTPTRHSSSSESMTAGMVEMTPFTRSLTQMLNENPGALNFDHSAFASDGVHNDGLGMLFSPGSLGLLPNGGLDLSSFSSPGKALDWGLLNTSPEKNSQASAGATSKYSSASADRSSSEHAGVSVTIKVEQMEEHASRNAASTTETESSDSSDEAAVRGHSAAQAS